MTADRLRAHDWYPGESVLAGVPALYATEHVPLWEKVVHLHYFVGACDWWVVELGEDRRVAFGLADLGDPQSAEWGYVDLVELSKVEVEHPAGFTLVVERDLLWTPTVFGEVERRRGR